MRSLQLSVCVFLSIFLAAVTGLARETHGPGGTGGGDRYVIDYIQTALKELYPWLQVNGSQLRPKVSSDEFLLAINPINMSSEEHVFESCNPEKWDDSSARGREVEVCFNANSKHYYISRSMWVIGATTKAKLALIAHEAFRYMGIEGDKYEVSKQMNILGNSSRPTLSGDPLVACVTRAKAIDSPATRVRMQNQCFFTFYKLSANGQHCMDYAKYIDSAADQVGARVQCFYMFKEQEDTFESCIQLGNRIGSPAEKATAQMECFNSFNSTN